MGKRKNGKSYHKCYTEGRVAKLKGELFEDNPYEDGIEADAWYVGWLSLEEDEKGEGKDV